jgi:hypothetical protein
MNLRQPYDQVIAVEVGANEPSRIIQGARAE